MNTRTRGIDDIGAAAAPLDLDDARARVLERVAPPTDEETVPLADAVGRVASAPIRSLTDLPPFPASAMDGYAFRWHQGIASLAVKGASLAGHPFAGSIGDGECVRITTGAPLPGWLRYRCRAGKLRPRRRFSAHQGQHPSRRQRAPPRQRPAPRRCGGGTRQTVEPVRHRRPGRLRLRCRAGLEASPGSGILTGDELQQPGTPLAFGNIYDSNRFAVEALLQRLPVDAGNLGVLTDSTAAVARGLAEASAEYRLILTSGGVSVGDADLVKSTLEAHGELAFWRLNLKPGKPLAFGRLGKALFLGLPGNPVSTIVTYLLIAKPAIEKLCGMRPSPPTTVAARLTEPIAHKPGREEYQRGIATYGQGDVQVRTTGDQGSNRMSTFAQANCLIRIPKNQASLTIGDRVQVLPFAGLL